MRDERRHEFAEIDDLRGSQGLRIGVPLAANQIELSMEHYFGGSDAEFVVFDFWIMGEGAKQRKPRWSVIRDVLGWID